MYSDVAATFFGPPNLADRIKTTTHTFGYTDVSKSVSEMISDADMLFVNVDSILQDIGPLRSSSITIGGNRDVGTPTPSPWGSNFSK